MRKNYLAKLMFTVIIGIALALSVFTGCTTTDEPNNEPTSFTVTFDSNGGSNVDKAFVESGKTLSKPADPTRDGYEFVAWLDINNNEYDFSTAVTKSFTLFAKWDPKSGTDQGETQKTYYTVTFNSNGGSSVNKDTVESGKTVSKPADPTRNGYTFDGWFEAGSSTAYDFTKAVTSDLTLTAKWTREQGTDQGETQKKYYTVTFDSNGGSSVKSASVESGKTVSKPDDPTRNGYTFDGWFEAGSSTAYDFTKAVTSDLTLTAKWSINTPSTPESGYYTVTFDSNSGSEVDAQYVKKNEKAVEPTAPVKAGNIFGGWYTESNSLYNFNTPVTSDFTLTAKWVTDNVSTYTVTFDTNGGGNVPAQEVTIGGKAVSPEDPEKNGYVFGGWYTTNELETLYNFNSAVSSDFTLYAKWTPVAEAQTFEVKFETNGGSSVSAQEVDKNGKAAKPKDPTKNGYSFAGWYIGETPYNFDAPVTSALTLTAKWTEKTTALTATSVNFNDMAVDTYPEGSTFADGLIKLKTGDWAIDENSWVITDANGNSVTASKRLKSVNVKSMEIDLSAYTGKVKLQFFVRTGNNEDFTRGVSLSNAQGTVIDSLTLTTKELFTFEVTVDCGSVYTLSTLVNGVNFYGINFIPVTE